MPGGPALAIAIAAVLLSAPSPGRADDPRMAIQPGKGPSPIPVKRTDEKGVVSGGVMESMVAHVKHVDLSKREVTLRGPGGRVETFEAGPEVKNLEKLEVGDRVSIRYRVGVVLRLQPPGEESAAPEVSNQVQRTGKGDVLAGTETLRVRTTMTVASIDTASRVVTLQAKDGKPIWSRPDRTSLSTPSRSGTGSRPPTPQRSRCRWSRPTGNSVRPGPD